MKLSDDAAKKWLKAQWRVLFGVLKQASIPLIASLAWASYTTLRANDDWTKWVQTFTATLAILSILAGQWFRVSKQLRDRDDFGSLNTRMDSLHSLMEGIQQNQPDGREAPIVIRQVERQAPIGPNLIKDHRLHTEMEAQDFFQQAWTLLEAGQDYPAMWMAAMGYERVLREQAVRLDVTTGPLSRIIEGLPEKYINGRLRRELGLLNRVRNNLAHPLPYPGKSTSAVDDRVRPEAVISSFEQASRELERVLELAFPRAMLPH